ncbi:MAG: hypothetical protein QF451_12130 [Nitrospinota bacterium]|nr:hypothetical protein [Nitrospinota bacterium]MDP7663986.1 hypothetical protein [Nitrospinota bacterium]
MSLGQAAGITEEQIAAIESDDYMRSSLLSGREKAAVLWAEHVTRNTARDRDDIFETVKKEFTQNELIELTMMSCLFNSWNRFMDSLHMPIEEQGEVDKIRKSVYLDPAKLKNYIQEMIDNWPDEFPEPDGQALS